MKLYTITINNRIYETTDMATAWLFASIFLADRMVSAKYQGMPKPLIMFLYEISVA